MPHGPKIEETNQVGPHPCGHPCRGPETVRRQGYERTTVRDIAAIAEIDPALVIRYFGSKDELFARVAVFDLKLPDLSKADRSKIGEMLVRHFLSLWEGENANGGMPIMLRSAASNEVAANKLRDVFAGQVMPALARAGDPSDASGTGRACFEPASRTGPLPLRSEAAAGRWVVTGADRPRGRPHDPALRDRRRLGEWSNTCQE